MTLNMQYYKSSVFIPIIGGLWISISWLLSLLWDEGLFYGLSPVIPCSGILYVYDKYLWKIWGFNFLNTMPNINGMYRGLIEYSYKGQDGSKECEMVIKQTCSSIKITSIFHNENESNTQSESIEAFIKMDEFEDARLYFYYRNEGSCKNGDTLEQHDGFNIFKIIKDKDKTTLEGKYFTNRSLNQTKGCINVTKTG